MIKTEKNKSLLILHVVRNTNTLVEVTFKEFFYNFYLLNSSFKKLTVLRNN